MTQAAIEEQVNALKAVTQTATKSKEAAQRFLVAAGIIEQETLTVHSNMLQKPPGALDLPRLRRPKK